MEDQPIVSEANKEFLDEVSPSRLQHCISELFRSMLARKDDMALKTSLAKKLKNYAKNRQITLANSNDDLEDKMLQDLKDREKERKVVEDDYLDELKIYDLTVVQEYWRKFTKKMLGLLVSNSSKAKYEKSDGFDPTLVDSRAPTCFHLNYVMNYSNTVRF